MGFLEIAEIAIGLGQKFIEAFAGVDLGIFDT